MSLKRYAFAKKIIKIRFTKVWGTCVRTALPLFYRAKKLIPERPFFCSVEGYFWNLGSLCAIQNDFMQFGWSVK